MKLKSLLIVVALLAAASLAVFVARRPAPALSTDARIGSPLVDQATVETAEQLRFSDQGKTITLVRHSDGVWRVPGYYDLPADFTKLSRFVGELTEAKISRLVTTSADRIARLEFKDSQIALLDAAGKELWSVTLGKMFENGGRFIRFGAEQKAYLASLNAWLDTEPKNWADAQIVTLKPDEVAKLELSFEGAPPVVISRAKKEDPWTAASIPAGQKLKTDRINSALGSLTSVRFTDTNDPTDPKVAEARAHSRLFNLTTFDGKNYSFTFARKPEEKKIKPPAADATSGPAALGKSSDLVSASGEIKPADALDKLKPEFETIPAGPVYVSVTSSDEKSPLNALMTKRAFQVSDYVVTGLPQKPEELFEPAPAQTPPSIAAPTPAPSAKP